MIVLFPIAWPFLVIWLMFRLWRVTLLLLAIGLCAAVYSQSQMWGGLLFVGLLILAIRALGAHQRAVARRVGAAQVRYGQQLDLAAAREYEKMEIQAELNARAMAKVARELC